MIKNFNFYTLEELLEKKNDHPVEWLVDKLIARETIVLLAAEPSTGKTWLALEIARAVSRGEAFLDSFTTVKSGVLFIDEESGTDMLRQRCKTLEIPKDADIGFFPYNGFKMTQETAEQLASFCKEHGYGLVIFDSLVRIHDGDENSARDMARLFGHFKVLKKEGIACLIICHSPKPAEVGSPYTVARKNRVRGSSDILAAADICMIMSAKADSKVATISQIKNRLDREISPFEVEFVKDDESKSHWELNGCVITKQQAKEKEARMMDDTVIEFLKEHPGSEQKEVTTMCRWSGAKDSASAKGKEYVKKRLKLLTEQGHVLKEKGYKNSHLYRLNPEKPYEATNKEES